MTTRPDPVGVPSAKSQVKLEALASVSVAEKVTGDPLAEVYLPLNGLTLNDGPDSVLALDGAANPAIVTAKGGTLKPLDPNASRTRTATLWMPAEDQVQLCVCPPGEKPPSGL